MGRPRILVDLDNVVYDWTRSMANWLYHNKATQTVPPRLMEQYGQWAVWEDWGIPEGEFMRWWRLGIEEGVIYGKGPIVPGARNALWQLSDAEWDIQICTNRLTKFGLHDQIVYNTVSWLKDNAIPYRGLLFTADKKQVLAEAIVDDREDNTHKTMHDQVFVFPTNHNQSRPVLPSEQEEFWQNIVNVLT